MCPHHDLISRLQLGACLACSQVRAVRQTWPLRQGCCGCSRSNNKPSILWSSREVTSIKLPLSRKEGAGSILDQYNISIRFICIKSVSNSVSNTI
ncbi:Histidine protein kinase DivJ [Fusarium oxysporum f. sp. albedinis]|nr:Histidine protein kinase DivJ [Fusarium oxysporum f. sp. albedinis]